jgi:glucokinase
MATTDRKILGIDVGGTHVKMGIVDMEGNIHDFYSYSTADWRSAGNFVSKLVQAISYRLVNHKDVTEIGIGLPGTLNKTRTIPLEITAIPELNNTRLHETLQERFPSAKICLENDANAAALGEYHFSPNHEESTFTFITIGTGIGSAAVIDGKIFLGGDGNALELGHIVSRFGKRLEQNIGKAGIINLATMRLEQYEGETLVSRTEPIRASELVVAAEKGDEFARAVFHEVGEILGEGIVAMVRILDIKTVIVGGGLSPSFEFIAPGIHAITDKYLTPYYLKALKVRRATLGNDAGLLGAASLCF